jgi:hypothetical protein
VSVDIHVLYYPPATRPDWWAECLESLRAADRLGARAHVIDGVPGHIGAGRALGYRCGSAEYVSYVDSDDVLAAPLLPACVKSLERAPDLAGVYTDFEWVDETGTSLGIVRRGEWSPARHLTLDSARPKQLSVMRRSAVELCLDDLERWPVGADAVLAGLVGRWGHVPGVGYRRRRKAGHGSAGREYTGVAGRAILERLGSGLRRLMIV